MYWLQWELGQTSYRLLHQVCLQAANNLNLKLYLSGWYCVHCSYSTPAVMWSFTASKHLRVICFKILTKKTYSNIRHIPFFLWSSWWRCGPNRISTVRCHSGRNFFLMVDAGWFMTRERYRAIFEDKAPIWFKRGITRRTKNWMRIWKYHQFIFSLFPLIPGYDQGCTGIGMPDVYPVS